MAFGDLDLPDTLVRKNLTSRAFFWREICLLLAMFRIFHFWGFWKLYRRKIFLGSFFFGLVIKTRQITYSLSNSVVWELQKKSLIEENSSDNFVRSIILNILISFRSFHKLLGEKNSAICAYSFLLKSFKLVEWLKANGLKDSGQKFIYSLINFWEKITTSWPFFYYSRLPSERK